MKLARVKQRLAEMLFEERHKFMEKLKALKKKKQTLEEYLENEMLEKEYKRQMEVYKRNEAKSWVEKYSLDKDELSYQGFQKHIETIEKQKRLWSQEQVKMMYQQFSEKKQRMKYEQEKELQISQKMF